MPAKLSTPPTTSIQTHMSRRPLPEFDAIPEECQQFFTDDYIDDHHVSRAWAHDPAVVEAMLAYLSGLDDQLGQRREERTIPTVALGLLVDFYLWLCNCIVSVAPPFGGGGFVDWTPDEETVSELFEPM